MEDANFFLQLLNTEDWLKNIGDRKINSLADAEAYLKNTIIPSYEKPPYGFLVIEIGRTAVGICGLVQRDYLDKPDLGFALLPEYYGESYARKAAELVIQESNMDLFAITIESNLASKRLLERLGFAYQKLIIEPESKESLMLFRREKS